MKATFEQAHLMVKWAMPPQSHSMRGMNSYAVPSWDVIRYAKTFEDKMDKFGVASASEAKCELRYVTLNEAPNMMYFCVRPDPDTLPAGLQKHDEALYGTLTEGVWTTGATEQRYMSKKCNMEITKIDMSINTSSNTLN